MYPLTKLSFKLFKSLAIFIQSLEALVVFLQKLVKLVVEEESVSKVGTGVYVLWAAYPELLLLEL